MRWLAFGTYDVDAHPRVAVLLQGLRDHGEELDELVEPLGLSTARRVAAVQRPWLLPALALRIGSCWVRLIGRTLPRLVGTHAPYDAVLVGYLGQFDVLLLRALLGVGRLRRPRRRRPIVVLDHLVSGAGTAGDRGLARAGGLRHRLLGALDRLALGAADVILLDTAARRAELTPAARAKAVVVPVGATHEWFAAGARAAEAPASSPTPGGGATSADPLRVIFVGLFTPLQGTEVIARALAELDGLDGHLEVTMAGTGQDHSIAQRIAAKARGVTWLDWVPAGELPDLVGAHDVGLGIVGTTAKALTVVPTKVYQAAAAGCAIVTSDTGPQRDSLGSAAVFVPPGDATALARALTELEADRGRLTAMRRAARDRAEAHYTPRTCVTPLLDHLATGRREPLR